MNILSEKKIDKSRTSARFAMEPQKRHFLNTNFKPNGLMKIYVIVGGACTDLDFSTTNFCAPSPFLWWHFGHKNGIARTPWCTS